jgi:hypothetical protein
VNNPETGKFFVHCKAGFIVPVLLEAHIATRSTDWDTINVYKEMKNYNYSNGLGARKAWFVREEGGAEQSGY